MPVDLAAVLIAGAYVIAGVGVLSAVGWLPDKPLGMVCAVGLAYMAGLAATMLIAVALLCAGIAVHAGVFVLVSLIVGGAGVGIGVQRGRVHWRPGRVQLRTAWMLGSAAEKSAEYWLAAAVGVILLVYLVLGYRWSKTVPLGSWDAWSIWSRKGTMLLDFGTLPASFFASPSYAFMHPDYPLLVPMFESIWFRFVGSADTQSLHVQFWLMFVAFLGAAAYISARVTRPAIWAPLVGLIAVVPAVVGQLVTLYADVPMGMFLMLGVLLLGMWVKQRRGAELALAALFLAAAANTKNEGLTSATCALAIAFVVTAIKPIPGRRRTDLQVLFIAAGSFAVAVAPWRLWLAFHHIGGDMPVGKGLDPAFLAGRADRISPTITALYDQIANQSAWYYLLPLAIAVVLASAVVRSSRRAAAFYGLTGVAVFVLVVWAYMINPNTLSFLIPTSASRTVDGLMFVAIAALLDLTGSVFPRRGALQELQVDREMPIDPEAAPQPATAVAVPTGARDASTD
jgi:hypothetical protein